MDHNAGLGWGTLSLVNAGLAQTKGRRRLVWWLLSLVLGPVATLLIVVLPPPQPDQTAVRVSGDPGWPR